MHFPIFATFLAFLVTAILAVPIDQSPATPLVTRGPAGCNSLSCLLISYADTTQVDLNNVDCFNMGKEVRGVLIGECSCTFFA